MKVLALDPGERVGWATGTISAEGKLTFGHHGITALKDMALKLHEVAGDYDVIVYETFRLSSRGARVMIGSDLQTAQFVGQVRLCAWLNPRVRLVSQGPAVKSIALKSASPALKRILARLPKTHDDAHDGDAAMHLHHYWFTNYAGGKDAIKTRP